MVAAPCLQGQPSISNSRTFWAQIQQIIARRNLEELVYLGDLPQGQDIRTPVQASGVTRQTRLYSEQIRAGQSKI